MLPRKLTILSQSQQRADAHRALPGCHLLLGLLQGIGRDPVEGRQLGHPSTGEAFPAGDVSAAER
jgi:hypothetical protein